MQDELIKVFEILKGMMIKQMNRLTSLWHIKINPEKPGNVRDHATRVSTIQDLMNLIKYGWPSKNKSAEKLSCLLPSQ